MKVTFVKSGILDGVVRAKGAEVEVTDEVAERLADGGFIATGKEAPKPLTKAELLAQAAEDGLELEEVTEKSTKAEIEAAIEAARKQ